jgi:uncharacterized protein (TIGR03435 family)
MILQTLALATFFATAGPIYSQTPAFDVATIKPSAPNDRGYTVYNDVGGGIKLENMTLKDLIAFAWDVRDFQISGGPGWINSTHYDISAKSQEVHGMMQLRPLVQPLLTERFQLVLHKGTKELSYYALVVGKNEAKLHASQASSPEMRGGGKGELAARGIPLSMLAAQLADDLERPVLDQTGIAGNFNINLQWTPDNAEQKSDPSRPSLFTAVQEQLGLKLESRKGPVEILVIDRAERPSEN